MIVRINQELCEACGICGRVCPRYIPVTIENENKKITLISPERINLCMQCGHCVAVCSNGAIHVESLNEEKFASVKGPGINDKQFLSLLRQRRSVRRYRNKLVPREIIKTSDPQKACRGSLSLIETERKVLI